VLYGDLASTLPTILPLPAGIALLVFQMLFVPCVGTIAAIRQETRSWRWTFFSLGLMLALSFGLAVLVYQIARLF
jgi:ferrous iron transport protein B